MSFSAELLQRLQGTRPARPLGSTGRRPVVFGGAPKTSSWDVRESVGVAAGFVERGLRPQPRSMRPAGRRVRQAGGLCSPMRCARLAHVVVFTAACAMASRCSAAKTSGGR
jgi:hypothetical protein